MKIALISDTHDRLDILERALNHIKETGVECLIHSGDLAHSETLEFICKKFHGEIIYVGGNADIDPEQIKGLEKIYPSLKVFDKQAELAIGELKIAVTHKPVEAKRLALGGSYDLIIHGHDHKPWQSFQKNTEILNPGNLADTRYPATFALYDTKVRKAELVQIEKLPR